MRYYLIVGEASGDLHASRLIQALKAEDPEASFRGFGGDLMVAEGMTLVRHYRELAYMGVVAVALHARTILRGMKQCKQDMVDWKPDVVILVDYPGFNLKIAKFVHSIALCPVYYYIAPKIWAWKEGRIKAIRRDVDELFSILPFEVDFFEKKHGYPIHYVGNPTMDEVTDFRKGYSETFEAFCRRHQFEAGNKRGVITLMPGSRVQEIELNLPVMLDAVKPYSEDYQVLLAVAPDEHVRTVYQPILRKHGVQVNLVANDTYPLLSHSTAALVTSGTATLETALFRVPQVVCYYIRAGWFVNVLRRLVLKVPFISLVNLIGGQEIVPELVANQMTVANCRHQLTTILPGGSAREKQLAGYTLVADRLGEAGAPERAAKLIIACRKIKKS